MSAMSDYLRLRRRVIHVHGLGPRPMGELLSEIGHRFGAMPEILDLLDQWQQLNPDTVRSLNGDRFPPLLAEVPK